MSARYPNGAAKLTPMQERCIEALATQDQHIKQVSVGLRTTERAVMAHLCRARQSMEIRSNYGLVAWWWRNYGCKTIGPSL